MTLRVAQVNCSMARPGCDPPEQLRHLPSLRLIAEAAASAGIDVHVVQSSGRAQEHRENGVCYHFVREPLLRPNGATGAMPWKPAAAIRRLRPDVVHFHGLEHPLHLYAACRTPAPVMVQDHASRPGGRAGMLRRWSLGRASACAFTSADQAQPFAAAGELPLRLDVLQIPECSTLFTPGPQEEARRRSGVHGDPALLWVGHLDRNKDPLTVLRAVRLALARLPRLHLWCAYPTAQLLGECEELLRRDPVLGRHVHLLGRIPHAQVETLCRACDLFVLASHREGSGYALIEALACGLVPVVTDIPSFRALLDGGAVGSLVPLGDPGRFAAEIVRQARSIDGATRPRVAAHFDRHLSPPALGRRLAEAYEHVARSRGPQ